MKKRFHWFLATLLLVSATMQALPAQKRKTQNVILLMTDGLRWQEVFTGADPLLMNTKDGNIKSLDALKQKFWRETPQERREALLPFLWKTIAKQGQIYGDQTQGSVATVTNGRNFSYPGYSETLCGFPDSRIISNAKIPNANTTVFEWLNQKPAFQGKVAAFGAWDVFPSIFNRERAGFLINAGYEPLEIKPTTPKIELLNRLKAESPRYWSGEPYDAYTYHTAVEYVKLRKPRLLFLSLGETDEWAHEGRYDEYLESAHRVDNYIQHLWETVQAMPFYRNKTTLIVLVDHGRGDAPVEWKGHGAGVKGSQNIWMAFLGPDTPALGNRSQIAPVTQSQIAATLAEFLGESYTAEVPKAGQPLRDVFEKR